MVGLRSNYYFIGSPLKGPDRPIKILKMRIGMDFEAAARTFDCEPTLTDSQFLQFCREGYILLKGVRAGREQSKDL